MPAGRCFGSVSLRIAKGLRTIRRMPGASGASANVWCQEGRWGVTPKRAPFPAAARFGQGMGWLAQERNSPVRPGPWAMVWLSLRCIQDWDCRLYAMPCAPSGPTAIWQVSATGKSSPDEETGKVPVLVVQPVDHGVDD